jgi:hypothetical protein
MRGRNLLAIGLVAAIACSDSSNSENKANEKGSNTGGSTLTGTIYGLTAGPDSQRVEIAGATVTLIKVGDLVPPPPGPDTTDTPSPPGGDTMLTVRQGVRALVDTVVGPPDTTSTPPPPPGCAPGVEVATVTTGSDGKWSVSGLGSGYYTVIVNGPVGGPWSGIEYCGLVVSSQGENDLTLYLPQSPGPDPVP